MIQETDCCSNYAWRQLTFQSIFCCFYVGNIWLPDSFQNCHWIVWEDESWPPHIIILWPRMCEGLLPLACRCLMMFGATLWFRSMLVAKSLIWTYTIVVFKYSFLYYFFNSPSSNICVRWIPRATAPSPHATLCTPLPTISLSDRSICMRLIITSSWRLHMPEYYSLFTKKTDTESSQIFALLC